VLCYHQPSADVFVTVAACRRLVLIASQHSISKTRSTRHSKKGIKRHTESN
jgi:hypothetical protein